MANIVEIENLYYRYRDGTLALDGLTMAIPRGSKAALLGPNGAGKSTLLLHFNGINTCQQGVVRVDGREVGRDSRWVRNLVGLVFQDPDDQVFSMTVYDDVAFGPINQGLAHGELSDRVEWALRAVDLWDLRDKAPHHLSFGQKKRVAIAGVLAMDPQIIVLDEPTAYLDPVGQAALLQILEGLHAHGKTIVIATHDVDMTAEWADKLVVIKNGRTLAEGGTELLVDEGLIAEAGLRFPVVTQIFRQFPDLAGQLPTTVTGAVAAIRRLCRQ